MILDQNLQKKNMTLNQTIISASKDHLYSFKNHEGGDLEQAIADDEKSSIKIF